MFNGLRVRCVHSALSDTDGQALLYVPPSDMSASLEPGFNANVVHTMQPSAQRLDIYASEYPIDGPLVKGDH